MKYPWEEVEMTGTEEVEKALELVVDLLKRKLVAFAV